MDRLIQSGVFLEVVLLCEIDSLLSLRLTCHAISQLISAYQSSIARAVARNTFPLSKLLLKLSDNEAYSIRWLIGLVPKHLAAISLAKWNCCRNEPDLAIFYNSRVKAEDPLGEHIRQRAINGWRIYQKLSLIAHEVDRIPEKDLPSSTFRKWLKSKSSSTARELDKLHKRELLVLHRRLQFIRSLSREECSNYRLVMWFFIASAFKHYQSRYLVRDWGPERRDLIGDAGAPCWITWYLLKAGPQLFWKYWWVRRGLCWPQFDTENPPQISPLDDIIEAWKTRSTAQIRMETSFAIHVESKMAPRRGEIARFSIFDDVVAYWREVRKLAPKNHRTYTSTVEDTTKCVPFILRRRQSMIREGSKAWTGYWYTPEFT